MQGSALRVASFTGPADTSTQTASGDGSPGGGANSTGTVASGTPTGSSPGGSGAASPGPHASATQLASVYLLQRAFEPSQLLGLDGQLVATQAGDTWPLRVRAGAPTAPGAPPTLTFTLNGTNASATAIDEIPTCDNRTTVYALNGTLHELVAAAIEGKRCSATLQEAISSQAGPVRFMAAQSNWSSVLQDPRANWTALVPSEQGFREHGAQAFASTAAWQDPGASPGSQLPPPDGVQAGALPGPGGPGGPAAGTPGGGGLGGPAGGGGPGGPAYLAGVPGTAGAGSTEPPPVTGLPPGISTDAWNCLGGYQFLPGGWTLAGLAQLPNGTRLETGCPGHYVILRLLPPPVPDGPQRVQFLGEDGTVATVAAGEIRSCSGGSVLVVDAPLTPLPPRNASQPARPAPCYPTITAAIQSAQLPSSVWRNFFYTAGLAQAANDSATEGTWLVPSDAALQHRIAVGLSEDWVAASLQDPALLHATGAFHVIPGRGKSLAELRALNGTSLPTEYEGNNLTVAALPHPPPTGTDVVILALGDAAQILEGDLAVCGGQAVVHILNDTLRWEQSTAAAAAATGSAALAPRGTQLAAPAAGQPRTQAQPLLGEPSPEPEAAAAGGCSPFLEVAAATPALADEFASGAASFPGVAEYARQLPNNVTVVLTTSQAASAFVASLPRGMVQALATNPQALINLLSFSTMTPALRVEDMKDGEALPTFAQSPQGQRLCLTVRKQGSQVTLVGPSNSARIIFPDIPMCQGYLHVADTPLLPLGVEQLGGSPEASPAAPQPPSPAPLQSPAAPPAEAAPTTAAPAAGAPAGAASSGGPPAGQSASKCLPVDSLFFTTPEFSAFAEVVKASGLLAQLSGATTAGNLTLLVPTNSAVDTLLAALPLGSRAALLGSPAAATALVSYHLVAGAWQAGQLYEGQLLPTLARDASGARLNLTAHTSAGGPTAAAGGGGPPAIRISGAANSANVVAADLETCGGVAHAIDAVLLPVAVQAASSGS